MIPALRPSMPKIRAVFVAMLLLVPVHASGDYLEVQRAATIKTAPNRAAPIIVRPPIGQTLVLVETEQTNGYYHVRLPVREGTGWIYRTLVRRHPGAPPELPVRPDAAALQPVLIDGTPLSDQEREFAERHLALGRPQAVHERYRQGYVTAVDARLKIPVWVQYVLTDDELSGPGRRRDNFKADASIPKIARAGLADYRSSGYDRGHMAPAGDMQRSQPVMDESFLLSNIAPQVGIGFNRHIWAELENAARQWVRIRNQLTIIMGPIFVANSDGIVSYEVIGENQVAVPTAFFKIVVDYKGPGQTEVLAFIIPNEKLTGRHYSEFLVSVNEVEAATGLDFLTALPEEEQATIEAERAREVWPLVGPPADEAENGHTEEHEG